MVLFARAQISTSLVKDFLFRHICDHSCLAASPRRSLIGSLVAPLDASCLTAMRACRSGHGMVSVAAVLRKHCMIHDFHFLGSVSGKASISLGSRRQQDFPVLPTLYHRQNSPFLTKCALGQRSLTFQSITLCWRTDQAFSQTLRKSVLLPATISIGNEKLQEFRCIMESKTGLEAVESPLGLPVFGLKHPANAEYLAKQSQARAGLRKLSNRQ